MVKALVGALPCICVGHRCLKARPLVRAHTGIDTEPPVLALMRSAGGVASPALSICALVASHLFGLEQRWASTEPEVSMRIREERRAELRADLHRLWTVSVESELLGQRR